MYVRFAVYGLGSVREHYNRIFLNKYLYSISLINIIMCGIVKKVLIKVVFPYKIGINVYVSITLNFYVGEHEIGVRR